MKPNALAALALSFCAFTDTSRAAPLQTFFIRIHPAHANFLSKMTAADEEAMNRHFAYWKEQMAQHKLILAGPVPIEPGTFGIVIVRAADMADAEQLIQRDPSVVAHVTDYEIYPLKLALYEGNPR